MSAQSVVLDASILVAAALPNEPFHAGAKTLMQRLMAARADLYLPAIALAEVAAAIARGTGDERLALAVVVEYGQQFDLRRIAVDVALGDLAAELAAKHRIRGCDAVYLALAQTRHAVLVTLDRQQRQRTPPAIPARTPTQLLAEMETAAR
jgi:predicted nucleic acid-binding protein